MAASRMTRCKSCQALLCACDDWKWAGVQEPVREPFRVNIRWGRLSDMPRCEHGRIEGYCSCPSNRALIAEAL